MAEHERERIVISKFLVGFGITLGLMIAFLKMVMG